MFCFSLPHKEVRIGGVFLEFAPHIKAVHLDYCANHAKFVHSIEKYKSVFIAICMNCTKFLFIYLYTTGKTSALCLMV